MDLNGQTLMEQLYARLASDSELGERIDGSIKFVLHGDSGGVWVLTGGRKPSLVAKIMDADCTLETSVETLAAIARGALSAQVAFLANDLKVQGSTELCLQLVHLWHD